MQKFTKISTHARKCFMHKQTHTNQNNGLKNAVMTKQYKNIFYIMQNNNNNNKADKRKCQLLEYSSEKKKKIALL